MQLPATCKAFFSRFSQSVTGHFSSVVKPSFSDKMGTGRLTQLGKQLYQFRQLIVGIQAAGIRKHPDARVVNSLRLLANLRLRFRERLAVCADAENRQD